MGLVTLEILIKVIMNTFAVVPLMSWSTLKLFKILYLLNETILAR